jgi:hypothetical protein
LGHTDAVDLSGGPNIAEITQTVARPQTECPQANMQYHLGYVDIRISLFHHSNIPPDIYRQAHLRAGWAEPRSFEPLSATLQAKTFHP